MGTFMGMPPLTFIAFLALIIALFGYMAHGMVRNAIKKQITQGQLCMFITKSRKLEFMILPEEAGKINAPPHHEFSEGQPRLYFTNRKFTLTTQYPPFVPLWLGITETANVTIWEEGDSQPLLPSDEQQFVTPEMISALVTQNVMALIVKKAGEQFGAALSAMGKFPWYFWVILVVNLLIGIGTLWAVINVLNLMQYNAGMVNP